jgi:hypothetical protein
MDDPLGLGGLYVPALLKSGLDDRQFVNGHYAQDSNASRLRENPPLEDASDMPSPATEMFGDLSQSQVGDFTHRWILVVMLSTTIILRQYSI